MHRLQFGPDLKVLVCLVSGPTALALLFNSHQSLSCVQLTNLVTAHVITSRLQRFPIRVSQSNRCVRMVEEDGPAMDLAIWGGITVVGWEQFLLLALASYRLTHLLVFDSITEPIRQWFEERGWLGDLIGCYWCCGVWVSGALVGLLMLWPVPARVIILILAVAGGQSLIETLVQRREQE